eukprot:1186567-Prorocentrum_minimum.AAC.1
MFRTLQQLQVYTEQLQVYYMVYPAFRMADVSSSGFSFVPKPTLVAFKLLGLNPCAARLLRAFTHHARDPIYIRIRIRTNSGLVIQRRMYVYNHKNILLGKKFVPEMNGACLDKSGELITIDLNLVHTVEDEYVVNEIERHSDRKFVKVVQRVQKLRRLPASLRAVSAFSAAGTVGSGKINLHTTIVE